VILEEGVYLQIKKKKSRPTDPNVEDYAIGNTPIFFGLGERPFNLKGTYFFGYDE
jgi:hypothetical protein